MFISAMISIFWIGCGVFLCSQTYRMIIKNSLAHENMNYLRTRGPILEKRYRDYEKHKRSQYRWKKPRQKAFRLLLENLNDEQRECLRKHKYFVVRGGTTKCLYRVAWTRNDETYGNVQRFCYWVPKKLALSGYNPFYVASSYCIGNLAFEIGDILLAQKMMIESEEIKFLCTVNRIYPTLCEKFRPSRTMVHQWKSEGRL